MNKVPPGLQQRQLHLPTATNKLRHNITFASVCRNQSFHLSCYLSHPHSSVIAVVRSPSPEPQHSPPLWLIERSKRLLFHSVSQNSGVQMGGNLILSFFHPVALSHLLVLLMSCWRGECDLFYNQQSINMHKMTQAQKNTVHKKLVSL